MSNQYLSFDISKQSAPQQLITGRQGDSQLKFVTMLFWDGDKNVPYDLTGKQVVFEALKPDNTRIVDYEGITILDAPAGLARYSFNEQVFSVAGTMQQAFFKITHTDSNNNVIADSTLEVAINILENRVEFGINSKDYLSEYDDLIAKVEKKFDDYAATVQDSIDKARSLHEQIVECTNLINSNGVIRKTEFGDITQLKQPEGNTVVDKLNNEFSQRGVNVKWFGAKGDGVTDDTLSIQRAIDTGFSVFIPPGKYNVSELKGFVSGQIIQGISKVDFQGGNNTQNITLLNGRGSADNYVIKNNLSNAITVRNLTIEGSKKTNGILVGNSSTIEGVKIQNCINGLSNIKVSNVMNCQINDCANGVMNATDSKITNNFIYRNEVGINFNNSYDNITVNNDNSIVNNKIEWNGIGISLTKATFNLISNNIINRNTTYGIYTKDTSNTTITGNQFERNLTNHLYLGGYQFNISANSFFRKKENDNQSGEFVPDVSIFTENISRSTISNNFVNGKMFGGTGIITSDVNISANTIDGINPDNIVVSIPATTAVHAQDTKIIIPLPNYFNGILSNPDNVEIISQKISFTTQSGNFYSTGGIIKSIYMSTSGIELTIFNGFNDNLVIKGTIKVRCIAPGLY